MTPTGLAFLFNCNYSCRCEDQKFNSYDYDTMEEHALRAECKFVGTPVAPGTCPGYVDVRRVPLTLPVSPIELHFDIVEACYQFVH